ncbi:MAG: hypothetical protein U0350_29285 [Caldilineaceae bacterium]
MMRKKKIFITIFIGFVVLFLNLALLANYSLANSQGNRIDTLLSLQVSRKTHTSITQFSCTSVSEIPQSECEALVAIFNNTGGVHWFEKGGWLSTTTPCTWYGITCKDGHVSELDLGSNGLTGTVPVELAKLPNLQSLSFEQNQLNGKISADIFLQLSRLTYLDLFKNQFTGSIPKELASHPSLTILDLGENQLVGTIPAEFGNMINLSVLALGKNQLSGTIPASLGNLTKLTSLQLDHNQLTGSIPPELGNLVNLQWLYLDDNQLIGQISASLAKLTQLENFPLNNNQLAGEIPSGFGYFSKLQVLNLDHNLFQGSLPGSLVHLTQLEFFKFDGTALCELTDTAFQSWLKSIKSLTKSGQVCSTPTYSVSGKVEDANHAPVIGATVKSSIGDMHITDSKGNFLFSGLGLESLILTVTLEGHAFHPTTHSISIPPDAINITFTLNPPLPTGGIANIKQFLDKCPQNDPIYSKLRSDFILRKNGVPIGEIACTEPVSNLSPYRQEVEFLQALRTIYYMDNGVPGQLPWTSLTLYTWLKSKIRGINFSDAAIHSHCCIKFDGETYMETPTGDVTQFRLDEIIPIVGVIFHEARHADGFPHNSDCGVPSGCDETYDVNNLSAYGMQVWLSEQWLSGNIHIGFSCLDNSHIGNEDSELDKFVNYLEDYHDGFISRFVNNKPIAPANINYPGGVCVPYLVSPIYLDFGTVPEHGSALERDFRLSYSGTPTQTWTISKNASWLSIEPTSGANDSTIRVTANPSSLQKGFYQDQIIVTSNDVTIPTQTVTVRLTVGKLNIYLPVIKR